MRLPPFNPRFAIGIAIVAMASTSILVKLAASAPATVIANYRLLFALILMWPIVLVKYRHELRSISRTNWFRLILTGILFSVHMGLWFYALQLTSVTSSVLILAIQPIFLLVASMLFFNERYSSAAAISILITVIGGLVIGYGDFNLGPMPFRGDLILVGSLIIVTIYELTTQRARRSLSLITYLTVIYTVAGTSLLIYNLSTGSQMIGFTGTQWGIFVLLAIIPTFLGVWLLNWALIWLRTQTISAGLLIEPMAATALSYYILKEAIAPLQWLGGTVILFGLLLFIMSTSKKRKLTISKRVTNQEED